MINTNGLYVGMPASEMVAWLVNNIPRIEAVLFRKIIHINALEKRATLEI